MIFTPRHAWVVARVLASYALNGEADELPEPVIASIAGYYHRATTTSRPMSLLIAIVMAILLGALGFHAFRGDDPG